MSPKISAKGATAKADKFFSLLVRRDGYCVNCGGSEFLQCAHGFPRGYRTTRWDERNAFCLCRKCHVYYTHRSVAWDDWMRERMGPALYDELRALTYSMEKVDVRAVAADLEERWKAYA